MWDLKTVPGYGVESRVQTDGGDIFACIGRMGYVVREQRLDGACAELLKEKASESTVAALGVSEVAFLCNS